MPSWGRRIASALGVLFAFWAGQAAAQTTPSIPSVKFVTNAPLITPANAATFYGSATTHTDELCALNGLMCGRARPVPIQELARALSRGGTLSSTQFAQNVFEYVYDNVQTEFRYGLSKGSFGALLDQSGTPFDQAALMVDLLAQGGVTASYQAGTITLTGAQFQNWTGLTNAQAACQFLANGGIPATVNSATSCSGLSGTVSTVSMSHVWVAIGSTLYDPSFKTYTQKSGLGSTALGTDMGCGTSCGSNAEAAAIPGGLQYDSGAGANYVQNIAYQQPGNGASTGALQTTLNGYAVSLQHYIQANLPTAQVSDIVGGAVINTASIYTPGTSLPYTTSSPTTWSAIPDQYRTELNISYGNLNTTIFADETYGYWLYIGGNGNDVTLFFEREMGTTAPVTPNLTDYWDALSTNEIVPLASNTYTASSSYNLLLTLTPRHPYAANSGAYMNDAYQKLVPMMNTEYSNGTFPAPLYLIQAWGRTGRGQVQRFTTMGSAKSPVSVGAFWGRYLQGSALPGAEDAFQNVMAPSQTATWLAQAGLATAAVDGIAQTATQEHHTIGIIFEALGNSGGLTDLTDGWTDFSSTSTNGSATSLQGSINTTAAAYNALEGSAEEQSTDLPESANAIRWFALSNEHGTKFYSASSTNIASILAESSNYTNQTFGNPETFIENYTSAGFQMIVPLNGQTGQWVSGTTTVNLLFAPLLAYSNSANQYAYVTTDEMKGAGAIFGSNDPAATVMATVRQTKPDKDITIDVSRSNGAPTVAAAPDMVTGSGKFPYSLPYQRFYSLDYIQQPTCSATGTGYGTYYYQYCSFNTNLNYSFYRLSQGWRDTYTISAAYGDDGFRGLGWESGLEASSSIAALYTIWSLNNAPRFQNYITTIFTSAWFEDQLSANTITISRPPNTETLYQLPDGTYFDRDNEFQNISVSGSRVREISPYGDAFEWSYTGITFSATARDGGLLSFAPYDVSTGVWRLNLFPIQSWLFPDGIKLTFNYLNSSNGVLTSVTNSLGRSVRSPAMLSP